MSFFLNISIGKKLLIAFLSVLVVQIGVAALTYENLSIIRRNAEWTDHSHNVLSQMNTIVGSMVNQETGVRGYLISGDTAFLAPQESGAKDFRQAFDTVKKLTSDNPPQQTRLNELLALATDWQTKVAAEQIRLMKGNAEDQEKARDMERKGLGKRYMDGLRAKANEIITVETTLIDQRQLTSVASQTTARNGLIIGSVISTLFVLLAIVLLNKTIAATIRNLTSVMLKLADGDVAVDVGRLDRQDEVGSMAKAVEVFKQNGLKTRALEQEAIANRSASEAEQARIAEAVFVCYREELSAPVAVLAPPLHRRVALTKPF